MQISHFVGQGANVEMMLFLLKSARLNKEVSAPKSDLRAKMCNNDFILKASFKSLLDNLTFLVREPFSFYKSAANA